MVQVWLGQTVTCWHTNSPGHIWATLYTIMFAFSSFYGGSLLMACLYCRKMFVVCVNKKCAVCVCVCVCGVFTLFYLMELARRDVACQGYTHVPIIHMLASLIINSLWSIFFFVVFPVNATTLQYMFLITKQTNANSDCHWTRLSFNIKSTNRMHYHRALPHPYPFFTHGLLFEVFPEPLSQWYWTWGTCTPGGTRKRVRGT